MLGVAGFAGLVDPRAERAKRHELLDIIVITICGVICGAEWRSRSSAILKAIYLAAEVTMKYGAISNSWRNQLDTAIPVARVHHHH